MKVISWFFSNSQLIRKVIEDEINVDNGTSEESTLDETDEMECESDQLMEEVRFFKSVLR